MASTNKDKSKAGKPAARKAEGQKPARRFDSAGWGFWSVSFCVLLIPSAYISWLLRSEDTKWLATICLTVIIASIAAGVLATVVNTVLQRLDSRKHATQKKKGGRAR